MERKYLQQGGSVDEEGFRRAIERLGLLAQADDSGEPDLIEEIEKIDAEVQRERARRGPHHPLG